MTNNRRGVLEAFYGRPWSWDERHAMIDFMREEGFNAYVYAPKNDPVHRNRWEEPYTSIEWAQFRQLAEHARSAGVEFMFGLSALSFRYSSPEHLGVLRDKLRTAQRHGIRSFSLLLDDMPNHFEHPEDARAFPDLARAQAWLVNELSRDLTEDGELYFCPTEYCGQGNSAYLWALGSSAKRSVRFFWTGQDVCSPTITEADVQRVSEVVRRSVSVWDNFPVNDLHMHVDLHVAPLEGRDAHVATNDGGYFAAAGPLPAASRIALRTTAAFLRDPHAYDPRAAFRAAVRASTASLAEAEAVEFLADLARRHPLVQPTTHLNHGLWPAIDAFWAAYGGPPAEAGPDVKGRPQPRPVQPDEEPLRRAARDMERHADTLQRLQDPALRRDVAPWADKLAGWARVLKYALGAFDHPHDPRAREYVIEEIALVRANFHWVAGDTIDSLARRMVWHAEARSTNGKEHA